MSRSSLVLTEFATDPKSYAWDFVLHYASFVPMLSHNRCVCGSVVQEKTFSEPFKKDMTGCYAGWIEKYEIC